MKIFKYILLGGFILPGLISCQMQEELRSGKDKEAQGALKLSVENKVPQSMTKADEPELKDYSVVISGFSANNTEIKADDYTYTYSTLEGNPVTLPVGDAYTVSANTPGKLSKSMTYPYYSGTSNLSIIKDLTTETKVVCKMQNTKISVNYGTDFKEYFKSWDITIDDGSESAISYTNEDLNPAPIYYYLGENGASSFKINVTAVTKSDEKTIKMSSVLTKENASESYDNDNENFVGGDAVSFDLGVKFDGLGFANITIAANVWFEDKSEDHVIDITDNIEQQPSNPTEPDNSDGDDSNGSDEPSEDPNAPQLVCDAFKTGVTFSYSEVEDGGGVPQTIVVIKTPNGLESMNVIIVGGNVSFNDAVAELGFTGEGVDVTSSNILSEVGVDKPEKGVTEYTFDIYKFYSMMNVFGPTVDSDSEAEEQDGNDAHIFKINVVDKEGLSVYGELKVTITK